MLVWHVRRQMGTSYTGALLLLSFHLMVKHQSPLNPLRDHLHITLHPHEIDRTEGIDETEMATAATQTVVIFPPHTLAIIEIPPL